MKSSKSNSKISVATNFLKASFQDITRIRSALLSALAPYPVLGGLCQRAIRSLHTHNFPIFQDRNDASFAVYSKSSLNYGSGQLLAPD